MWRSLTAMDEPEQAGAQHEAPVWRSISMQPPAQSEHPFYAAQQAPSYACMQQGQQQPQPAAQRAEAPSWRSLASAYARQHEAEQAACCHDQAAAAAFGVEPEAPAWRSLAAAAPEPPMYGGFGGMGGMDTPAEMPSYCSLSAMAAAEPPSAAVGQAAFGATKAAAAGPSQEEQARWQKQLSAAAAAANTTAANTTAAALSALSTADASADAAAAAEQQQQPPLFHAEWRDHSQEHYACVAGVRAADVAAQLRAALGACGCEEERGTFRASSWTIEVACHAKLYAPIHFTASIYRDAANPEQLTVVCQRVGGDLGAYARLVDELAKRCAALQRGSESQALPDMLGPPTPCELYPGSLAVARPQMQRHCELLRSGAHPSVRLEAARAIAGACDGADAGSAANRAMLVADFAAIVGVMLGDSHHSREVHLCGQAVLEQLLRFGDATARARMGVAAYEPRADAGLVQARELARKLGEA